MPWSAPKHCPAGHPPFNGRRCPVCSAAAKARADAARPTARERGYDSKWEKESKAYLSRPENQLCACGCGQPADVVDHRVAHKGSKRLFWDRSNWQPMARGCNSRKAAAEKGGFGNPVTKGRGASEFARHRPGPRPPSYAQDPEKWEF